MPQSKLYFHSLDALRFLAFLRVFLLHLPLNEGSPFLATLFSGGEIGVDLFFVLSGFLITYLLCKEKMEQGSVNKKAYLARRALRIWPLYFLGVAIAYTGNFIAERFGIANNTGYQPHPFFSLAFLENYRMIYMDTFPNGAPLRAFWSLCVEEHFYLLWLLLFLFIKPKNMPLTFLILWACGVVYRIAFFQMYPSKEFFDYDVVSKLDYFCCGGLAGYYLCFENEKIMQMIKKSSNSFRTLLIIITLCFFAFNQFFLEHARPDAIYFPVISAILFSMLILLIVTLGKSIFSNSGNVFNRMGKISFGLYVYHTVIISVLLVVANKAGVDINTNMINYILFCSVCFILTLLISSLSYKYFESFFLKLKKKYTVT